MKIPICILTFFLATPVLAADWATAERIVVESNHSATVLCAAAMSEDTAVRKASAWAIGRSPESIPAATIRRLLFDPAWSVRRLTCDALVRRPELRDTTLLLSLALHDPATPVRSKAINALAEIGETSLALHLAPLLDDADFAVRGNAVAAMRRLGYRAFSDTFEDLAARDPEYYVRFRAAETLKEWGLPAPEEFRSSGRSSSPGCDPHVSGMIALLAVAALSALAFKRWSAAFLLVMSIVAIVLCGVLAIDLFFGTNVNQGRISIALDADIPLSALARMGFPPPENAHEAASRIIARLNETGLNLDTAFATFTLDTYAYSPGRAQWNADAALPSLFRSNDSYRIAFLTDKNLFVEPYYMTSGWSKPSASITSIYKIDPVFLDEDGGVPEDNVVFFNRIFKVFAHEIGHMRGLDHCANARCIMMSFEEVEEMNFIGDTFCATCASLLKRE